MRQTTWILMCAMAALIFTAAFTTPDPVVAAPKKDDGPGSPGEPVSPARITFDDLSGHELRSDGLFSGEYVHDQPAGLEVFIGSQANTGNIFLRVPNPNATGRKLQITIPDNECGLTPGPQARDAGFKVSVDSVVSGGVFGIANGASETVPMRISIRDVFGDLYFVHFQSQSKGPCGGKGGSLVQVTRSEDGQSWTVNDTGDVCIEKHNPKGKGEYCAGPVEMNFSFTVECLAGECPSAP